MDICGVNVLNRLNEKVYEELLSCLDEEKRERIRRFRRWENAQSTLIGEILVRLGVYNKFQRTDLSFSKNKYGKPYLSEFEDLHFNISHSGEWVVCAISDAVVGIDVEHINPIDLDIAKRFFSKEEHEDLMAKEESLRLSYFFDLWTLKESYIKAVGMGLSMPLDSFTMKESKDYGFIVKTENEFRDCLFRQYTIDRRYKLSVCSVKDNFPDFVDIIDINTLCRDFLKIYKK